jgi:hypothetical protein
LGKYCELLKNKHEVEGIVLELETKIVYWIQYWCNEYLKCVSCAQEMGFHY